MRLIYSKLIEFMMEKVFTYLNNTRRLCGHYNFTPIQPKSRLFARNIQEVKL